MPLERAQCAFYSHFAPSALRAHQHQVADIDANNQQKQDGSAQQREKNGPHIANDDLQKGNNIRAQIEAPYAVLPLELFCDRIHFGQGRKYSFKNLGPTGFLRQTHVHKCNL